MRKSNLLLGGALVCLAPIAFNIIIDPFWRFNLVSIPFINAQRSVFAYAGRMGKAESVSRVRPQQIVIGGSKEEIAFDPHNPAWGSERVYNLGLAGMPLSEMELTLKHVTNTSPLKRALIGLDFLMFNQRREDVVYHTEVVDFDRDRLVLKPHDSCWKTLWRDADAVLGWKALGYSLHTALNQHSLEQTGNISLLANLLDDLSPGTEGLYWNELLKQTDDDAAYWAMIYDANGFRSNFPVAYQTNINGFGGHGQEDYYLEKIWRPGPDHLYCAGDTFATLHRIARNLTEQAVDARFFVEPLHARMYLAINHAGLWPQYEAFLRGITRVMAEAGFRFKIWNFGGINSITTEDVEAGKPARWWWEPSHYKQETGALMLERLLHYRQEDVPEDFGVEINYNNINQWLGQQSTALSAYANAHRDLDQAVAAATVASLKKAPTSGQCR